MEIFMEWSDNIDIDSDKYKMFGSKTIHTTRIRQSFTLTVNLGKKY